MKLREDMKVKVHKGQWWKKKDTGMVVQITGKRSCKSWAYKKLSGSRKAHGVYEKDLWLFWEKI